MLKGAEPAGIQGGVFVPSCRETSQACAAYGSKAQRKAGSGGNNQRGIRVAGSGGKRACVQRNVIRRVVPSTEERNRTGKVNLEPELTGNKVVVYKAGWWWQNQRQPAVFQR